MNIARLSSFRTLSNQRKAQVEAWQAAHTRQLALFEPHNDCRPAAERTAAGRYEQPTLLALLAADFIKESG